jgi:hypothetical protein
MRIHPTGFASLRSARLRVMRQPLGGLPFNSQEDKNGQDNP